MKRLDKALALAAVSLAVLPVRANVYLYEAEKFEDTGCWRADAALQKSAGSGVLSAASDGDGAETMIQTPGAGNCRSWIRAANLFETNQPPSKFTYQINGEEKEIAVKGEKGKFVWVDGGPVMLPGGYSSIGLTPVKGSKAVVDCVVVTDEGDFKPPADDKGIAKLRKDHAKE